MPNTLAHIGVQAFASRTAWPSADPKWIVAGCVLPDVPWIARRVVLLSSAEVDPVMLRYYVDVQGSLFGILILSAAVALLTTTFWSVFSLLGLNAALHLLVDALETKWANGVHLTAPFSWDLVNWGFFWPEGPIAIAITVLGLAAVIVLWKEGMMRKFGFARPGPLRGFLFVGMVALYLLVPLVFVGQLAAADNHYLATLGSSGEREGRYVEFDRVSYRNLPTGPSLQATTGEIIRLEGLRLSGSSQVSVRGVFETETTVRVLEHYVHSDWFREAASMLGLVLAGALWVSAVLWPGIRKRRRSQPINVPDAA